MQIDTELDGVKDNFLWLTVSFVAKETNNHEYQLRLNNINDRSLYTLSTAGEYQPDTCILEKESIPI